MNFDGLIQRVVQLRDTALEQERLLQDELALLHPRHRDAGRNLAHYLAVRQQDLRELQRRLACLGLSSLGRLEPSVLPSLNAVEHALRCLAGQPGVPVSEAPTIDLDSAEAELGQNADALLGTSPVARRTRIMVTLPLDANASLLEELLSGGTEVLRINCAKGDASSWARVIDKVRAAERKLGKRCRILCDLSGPNPRTCSLEADAEPGEVLARVSRGQHIYIASLDGYGRRAVAPPVPVVGFSLPQVLGDLEPGERIFYDDASMLGVVKDVQENGALIEVTFTRKPALKIKADKTLNFPDSRLTLPSLTERDLEALDFIARRADLVGLSFVRGTQDVIHLQQQLEQRSADLGIVLKIETTQAFNQLPRLLLAAMKSPRIGVMVARGDMAVELGFVRLAEAQEEILWMCEAARVPVIWATQVLENLNKNGVPSRAEVTDAAMSGRAECVMLNRGPNLLQALAFLREVLERMQEHQHKKRAMLRRLRISTLD